MHGVDSLPTVYHDFMVANTANKLHITRRMELEAAWRHLHRPKVSILGYNAATLRTDLSTIVGDQINLTSSLFGASAEEQAAEDKEREKLTKEFHDHEALTGPLNQQLLSAYKALEQALSEQRSQYPQLWTAYTTFEAAGGVNNSEAGNAFLNTMDAWYGSAAATATDKTEK